MKVPRMFESIMSNIPQILLVIGITVVLLVGLDWLLTKKGIIANLLNRIKSATWQKIVRFGLATMLVVTIAGLGIFVVSLVGSGFQLFKNSETSPSPFLNFIFPVPTAPAGLNKCNGKNEFRRRLFCACRRLWRRPAAPD